MATTQSYKARAVVLHTIRYGESGMIAHLLTDVGGRQSYMIQGAYSHSRGSRKAALFQPMFLLELEGYTRSSGELHYMREVRSLEPLSSLPFDVRKSTISLFMAEVLYRLVQEREQNTPLFDFVLSAVQQLDAMDSKTGALANFHLWFLVRLSAYLGFFPGNEYSEGDSFNIQSGLFVALPPPQELAMESESARLLGALMDMEVEQLGALPLGYAQRGEFMEAMLRFFGYHFDAVHSIQSLRILREVFE